MQDLLKPMEIEKSVEIRIAELQKFQQKLQKQLENCPNGKIHIVNSKGRVQYYQRTGAEDKSGKYIRKDNEQLIKRLLQKSYNEKEIRLIKKELSILDQFRKTYSTLPEQIKAVYDTYPVPAKKYIQPVDMTEEDFNREWTAYKFEGKELREGQSNFLTDRGEYVRSKSELIIANTLNKHEIPYRYECPLEIRKGLVVHPDFTVLNKRTRNVYYWEHRGMMDDRGYSTHSVQKVKEYERAGIFPGKNLILTEETSTVPLASYEITNIIRIYLT